MNSRGPNGRPIAACKARYRASRHRPAPTVKPLTNYRPATIEDAAEEESSLPWNRKLKALNHVIEDNDDTDHEQADQPGCAEQSRSGSTPDRREATAEEGDENLSGAPLSNTIPGIVTALHDEVDCEVRGELPIFRVDGPSHSADATIQLQPPPSTRTGTMSTRPGDDSREEEERLQFELEEITLEQLEIKKARVQRQMAALKRRKTG